MTAGGEGGRWRLILGTATCAAWAGPSLVGLARAGPRLAARPRSAAEWSAAVGVGVVSLGLLLLPASDLLTGFVRAYTVLLAAAFVAVTLFATAHESLLQRAVRAGLIAGVAAGGPARGGLGRPAWGAPPRGARRPARATMRRMGGRAPPAVTGYEPLVRRAR